MKLSILDQSLLIEGKTGADAVRDTVSLAIAADELGFSPHLAIRTSQSIIFTRVIPNCSLISYWSPD